MGLGLFRVLVKDDWGTKLMLMSQWVPPDAVVVKVRLFLAAAALLRVILCRLAFDDGFGGLRVGHHFRRLPRGWPVLGTRGTGAHLKKSRDYGDLRPSKDPDGDRLLQISQEAL